MGSRPSSQRSNGQSNGSVGSETERELRTENAKLQDKIAELERLKVPESVQQENERLRQENQYLKEQLSVNYSSVSLDAMSSPRTDKKDNLSLRSLRNNKSAIDVDVSCDIQTEDFSKDTQAEKSESDLHGNDVSKVELNASPDVSPSVPKKQKKPRRIHPNSVPQRMSDIDAYGQGLPLPDAELLRNNIRRSRLRKRMNDSGNSTGSSVGLSPEGSERAASSSPERTDQKDVFLGVESLNPGVEEYESRSGSEAKEDLLM